MKKERFSIILLGYFLITNSILFILLLIALSDYWKINGPLILLSIIFFSIFLVVLNSYIYAILSTYINLPKKFDNIKNNIASEKYNDVDAFQKDVASLLIDNFNAPGSNIIGGVFHFINSNKLKINSEIDIPLNIKEKDVIQFYRLKSKKAFLFIPISFNNKKLGYMSVTFSNVCFPFVITMLIDFVENYLDDQLMILTLLLNNKK